MTGVEGLIWGFIAGVVFTGIVALVTSNVVRGAVRDGRTKYTAQRDLIADEG